MLTFEGVKLQVRRRAAWRRGAPLLRAFAAAACGLQGVRARSERVEGGSERHVPERRAHAAGASRGHGASVRRAATRSCRSWSACPSSPASTRHVVRAYAVCCTQQPLCPSARALTRTRPPRACRSPPATRSRLRAAASWSSCPETCWCALLRLSCTSRTALLRPRTRSRTHRAHHACTNAAGGRGAPAEVQPSVPPYASGRFLVRLQRHVPPELRMNGRACGSINTLRVQ